jgi:hypothetical protein
MVPKLVPTDVIREDVSIEKADEDYGVVIDLEATHSEREALRR